MKREAKVTRTRQRAKGVSRIVEAFIRSSPKGGAPQTQGEQTAARYGSPRRRRHAPKQKAPPRRVELAKAHPLNGGYLERHALRARILNAPARIVTQFTPYIHPLQGWRSYPFSFPLFPFYLLKIKRLGVQKTRNVTENGECPIIFAPFSRRRDVKPKAKANAGKASTRTESTTARTFYETGRTTCKTGACFSGGAFSSFSRVFFLSSCN